MIAHSWRQKKYKPVLSDAFKACARDILIHCIKIEYSTRAQICYVNIRRLIIMQPANKKREHPKLANKSD